MYYFSNPNRFTNRNTSVRISEGVLNCVKVSIKRNFVCFTKLCGKHKEHSSWKIAKDCIKNVNKQSCEFLENIFNPNPNPIHNAFMNLTD